MSKKGLKVDLAPKSMRALTGTAHWGGCCNSIKIIAPGSTLTLGAPTSGDRFDDFLDAIDNIGPFLKKAKKGFIKQHNKDIKSRIKRLKENHKDAKNHFKGDELKEQAKDLKSRIKELKKSLK